MTSKLLAATAIAALSATLPTLAQERKFPATLLEQAVLPADTRIPAPQDAPLYLKQSGKFSTADRKRATGLGSVPGKDGVRPTGLSLPFDGQPVQGFSGIKAMPDGTFWSLSDNGFGNKLNSTDAALMVHKLSFDWAAGAVNRVQTIFLSDPDMKAPFPIVLEGSAQRYLTGGDFDVESIQPAADGFWLGEEFGPYLLHFTTDGKLTDVFDTVVEGEPVRSPDNPALTLPANPAAKMPAFNLKRSGGYEGLALSKDGSKLYGLLEGSRYLADGTVETADNHPALRIVEFDVAGKAWTGRSWLYPLSDGGEAIGDFNMIDAATALVIERDNGVGTGEPLCADAKPAPDCFDKPAKHKRIYKIEMTDANAGAAVRKIGYVDLMDVQDPDNKARQGGAGGVYTMPFVTIENVDVLDGARIIVGNDNNLPFSAGRAVNKADDTEFVVLSVPEFLAAE